jgi:hypothetical protein
MYSSDEAWPSLDESETRSERIRYLDIFPYINKPFALCEFDQMGEAAIIYHIFSPIGCRFCCCLLSVQTEARKLVAPSYTFSSPTEQHRVGRLFRQV